MSPPATLKQAVVQERCLFCGIELGITMRRPANIAFLEHIDVSPSCKRDYDGWRTHIRQDAGGD